MNELLNLLDLVRGCDQLRLFWRIDAKKAGVGNRRGADSNVNFFRAGIPKHLVDFSAGGGSDNGVIDGGNLLPL